MRKSVLTLALFVMAVSAPLAQAEEFEVKMLNKGEKGTMVFEPDFVRAMPGDTIRFLPTDKGHNVESIKGMLPEGVEAFKSKFNEEYVLELGRDGVYGIKCSPHFAMGMVALVLVGEPVNLEEAKTAKLNKMSKERLDTGFAAISQ